jgi:hypothetical protein
LAWQQKIDGDIDEKECKMNSLGSGMGGIGEAVNLNQN